MGMGFPLEWELYLNERGNGDGNENPTRWEWERLIFIGSPNNSHTFIKFIKSCHFWTSDANF